jgi:uncharacterized SAM-binding protein YcdF (DUF218 family)
LAPIYLPAIGKSIVVSDKLEKSDAILVLSGDSPKGERTLQAVRLFKQRWAPSLIFSGNTIAWQTNLADIMEKEALSMDINEKSIIKFKHKADSTLEEARLLKPFLISKKIKKIVVVTSNFHSRRAKRVLSNVYGSSIKIIIYPIKDSFYYNDPADWWKNRRYAKTFVEELIKTVWSYFER